MRSALLAFIVAASGIAASPPAAANCQLGGSACGDPFAIDCNGGVVCPIPWRTCSGCVCTTTSNGRTCLAPALQPGSVATVRIGKSASTPGDLDFAWDASCAPTSPDYAIYEGLLGVWYTHEPLRCTSAGALSLTLAPSPGDRYYLIAPILGDFTGSLGTNRSGTQRPDGDPSCTADRAIAPCP